MIPAEAKRPDNVQRPDQTEQIAATLWRRRVVWSHAADLQKKALNSARVTALALSILGALLETATGTILIGTGVIHTIAGAAGAVSLAAAAYVTAHWVTPDAIRRWTRMRSVSEALKAEFYMFRAGVSPYDGINAIQELRRKWDAISAAVQDLAAFEAAAANAAEEAMPSSQPGETYITARVEEQITGYYQRRAREHAKALRWLRRAEIGLGLAGALLGGLASYLGDTSGAGKGGLAAWVAVLTTVGGAISAHIAANRLDFLVMSYYATARRLEDLIADWRMPGTARTLEAWTKFVKDCEAAISVENEGWLAKWADQNSRK
jgi:hypothetical protein